MSAELPISRLVIEAGFAAVNHGLRAEMHDILAALPDWLDEPAQLARCEAVLLFGLGRRRAAAARLAALPDDDCAPLRALLNATSSEEKS
ncbi:EscG/YscG/SsaH family type III secretion system needle protein co-chaperone [Chromobacterium vaccinii]|uniref:EscG/YscG/SsaH family type III secretion system needle protein co-chaperone n=1 Tax=Chromobacterium vaccinii TaxID=1108595 RepID=A0ABV0FBJ8_9NEIS|nr:EscG/YscG/SsaH family type III secretion system needle protein co-chaperone [Chromobacterium vaccinii]QND86203.1 EscG/YscG/SsaH family type III secretion system needle protein co-chaperone [Chromobacterium vaccinii]QND91434.1 EscG/YscG/SsaH family type III secretion system needle protein co-chaperone [Chromobacterium vaccinii]SUX56117.1 type III secretion system protein, SsaH family [Chromobacterium vaccinii]